MSGKVLTIDAAGSKRERPTSFPTVAAAELASFLPGETCSVLETRRNYQFDTSSVETRDGIRVLTPAGGGRLLPVKTGSDDVEVPKIGTPDHQSLTQSLQIGLSAGTCNDKFVTDAGGGVINIASGEGMIRATNSSDSEIFAFRWAAVNGVAIPLNSVRYVGVEYNSGSPQAVVRTANDWNGQTEFQAATVVNEGGTLHILNNPQEACDGVQKIFHRLIETQPFQFAERLGGGRFSEVGTRNLSLSPCEFYDGLNEFPVTAKNTNTGDTFDAYYGSFTKVAAQTQWDNQNYDNAGTLTALSANRYGVHWLYIEMDDSFALVYGQGNYNTISDAEAALPPASLPLRLSLGSRLAAKLIFQKGASSAIQIESAFDVKFQSGMPVSHSDLVSVLGNGGYHLSEAERDAAIRIATPSQSGLMSAGQAKNIQYITVDSDGNVSITPTGAWNFLNSDYLSGFNTLMLGAGGISGNAYFRSSGANPSTINMRVGIKDSTGGLQDGIGFFPTWVNSTPGSYSVSTAVGALGVTAFTIKSTSMAASVEFNGDVEIGNIETAGKSIVAFDTFTADATLTQSSKSCTVINPSGTGVVMTMHLSPIDAIKQRTVNVSAFTVTLGRNSQKMAGAEANYTLSPRTAIDWQYYGATIGWIPISISTW